MAWWAAAGAVAKKMVVAEATSQAVRRSNGIITPAIAIVIEGLGITLFSLTAITTVGAMNFSVMGLAGIPSLGQFMSDTTTAGDSKAAGQKIADAAMTWVGKDFNPGVTAQCAFFVRQVFEDAGIDIGVASGKTFTKDGIGGDSYASAGLAGSFFSDEIGTQVSKEELQPGDLVAFTNTYGNWPWGTITHVGIYVGNGMMVDRSTSSMPVYHRSIDTFGDKFMFGVRPHVYAQVPSGSVGSLDDDFITLAIGNAEGTRRPDGGFNPAYYGHTDPGNGASNLGSFSYQVYQGGASTPEQADAVQLKRIKNAWSEAQANGFNPETKSELINFLDLYNQAPLAAKAFPQRLQQAKSQGLSGDAAILQARVDSFRTGSGAISASGFGHSESRLRADQQRRMNAMNQVL